MDSLNEPKITVASIKLHSTNPGCCSLVHDYLSPRVAQPAKQGQALTRSPADVLHKFNTQDMVDGFRV